MCQKPILQCVRSQSEQVSEANLYNYYLQTVEAVIFRLKQLFVTVCSIKLSLVFSRWEKLRSTIRLVNTVSMKRTNEIFSNGKYRVENKTVYMSGRFVLLHEWSISAGNTDNECKHLLKSSTLHPLKEKNAPIGSSFSFF